MQSLSSTIIDFGKGFWAIDRKLSGRNIDVYRGQNIPGNSKTIDRTVGLGIVISHKSTDIRLKSYQSSSRLYSLGMHFVRQLKKYSGEVRMDHKIGATYNLQWAVEKDDAERILEWFIPDFEIGTDQQKVLLRLIEEAAILGVTILLFRVKDH